MASQELNEIARSIVADNKGVLAADESTGTITKRFDSIGVESTEENRRAYRNLLFTTPGFEDYVGGVILYDETIRQAADDGTPFPELLAGKGVVPGIKVDTGAQDLADSVVTGLGQVTDWLREGPLNLSDSQLNGWIETAQETITENSREGSAVTRLTEVGTAVGQRQARAGKPHRGGVR